jgi:opacity protein-like surface antigen
MVYTGTPSGLPPGTVSGASTPAFSAGGWFLGGGVETTLAPLLPAGWFLRSEYRYAYYGSQNLPDTCTTPALCGTAVADTITFHPTVQTISAALVYKFNWFGAVNR